MKLGPVAGACLVVAHARAAGAAPPLPETREPAPQIAENSWRTLLLVRIDGTLGADSEHALRGLLAAERGQTELTLSLEHSELPVATWLRSALAERQALLVAILDVSAADGWQLTVVDAARGRAIVRRLPGSLSTNAASLEAVASILGSAAAALREGLEVASQPVEEVVSGAAPTAESVQPTPPAVVRREGRPAPSARRARWRARGSVAVAASSLADSVALTPGAAASLGAYESMGLGIRLAAAAYLPARFDSPLGAFELGRWQLALGVGWSLPLGPLQVEPELGTQIDLLRRSGASSVPGVFERADSEYVRSGALAALRLRTPFASFGAIELGGLAAYYPRRIRFVARSPDSQELGELSRASFSALLGVEIMSP